MKRVIILISILFFLNNYSFGQKYNKCRIDIKYHFSEDNYSIDSSHFDLYIIIPKTTKSTDYRFNFSDIWEFDFVDFDSLVGKQNIHNVIKYYLKEKKSKIIIEHPNHEYYLLSSFFPHAVNLVEYYEIIHQDKESSNLKVKVFTELPQYCFWYNKFKLYFILQKQVNCNQIPVVFETDWLKFDDFIGK